MPIFFFHVHDGQDLPDNVGTKFDGIRDAQLAAIRLAADLLQEGKLFWQGEEWSMAVEDEERKPLFTLRFTAEDLPALKKVSN